jgi:uncharacterized protein (TIGR02246 family)
MDQIRNLIAEKAAAMRAGDVETLIGLYTPDVTKFDLAPPLVNPAPRGTTALRTWFDTFDGPVDYEVRDLTVTAGEDVAYCHSVNRLSATPLGASQPFDLWFRVTICLRKLDGAWRITHEHQSTPFYMDGSMRAALDLKP